MTTTAERYSIQYRRLHYGSIKLVPVVRDPMKFPYTQEFYKDMWHVPGRKIESTETLVNRATKKGITVTITEHSGLGAEIVRLN